MLILKRWVGETVAIENKVFCMVLDNQRDGQLKLAFDAPECVPFHRFEIQEGS
ncbi:carbon storage regulator (plasmid) [Legionella pneumophila]|uniref:carbon storage regulator n=1 Tax=Legionella pneumophila TaxID=446 RepID=UPI001CBCD219|nr:carbon storage regulator [Legionella pneumophila]UAK70096.1 carbon storage regulator [Legionella pneumophila]